MVGVGDPGREKSRGLNPPPSVLLRHKSTPQRVPIQGHHVGFVSSASCACMCAGLKILIVLF